MKIEFPTLAESLVLIILLPFVTAALLVAVPFMLLAILFCYLRQVLCAWLEEGIYDVPQ